MTTQRMSEEHLKRLEARVKRQDEYLNRVLHLFTNILTMLVVLKNTSV